MRQFVSSLRERARGGSRATELESICIRAEMASAISTGPHNACNTLDARLHPEALFPHGDYVKAGTIRRIDVFSFFVTARSNFFATSRSLLAEFFIFSSRVARSR